MGAYLDSSQGNLGERFGAFQTLIASWDLPAAAETVREAREYVVESLSALPAIDSELAALVTSELVTNSVMHAATQLSVSLERWQYMVKLVVEDFSFQIPKLTPLDVSLDTGRGMHIIEKFSDAWGYELTERGKRVWASFKCE
jgi:anti-sigma regulatory factor (Ser/Thr protein kinase)